MQNRFSIRLLLLATALVAFSCAGFVFVSRNGISKASVDRIYTGLHKSELVAMLGEPHEKNAEGYWVYYVWGYSGFVHLTFDESGFVTDINL